MAVSYRKQMNFENSINFLNALDQYNASVGPPLEPRPMGSINGPMSAKSHKSSILTNWAPLLPPGGSKQPSLEPRRVTALNFTSLQWFSRTTFGASAHGFNKWAYECQKSEVKNFNKGGPFVASRWFKTTLPGAEKGHRIGFHLTSMVQ